MSRRLHILTQYLWPDDAPTGIYAEQVADSVACRGMDVRLVAGSGTYRPGGRPAPRTPIVRLAHRQGRRSNLLTTALEYGAVHRAFVQYLDREVKPGDVALLTSAPPTTVFLHRRVSKLKALGVYWLQDYYPELIRGVWDPPTVLRRKMRTAWDKALASWDHVVKSAGNLAYVGPNATVIRNWNTLPAGEPRPAVAGTALYSGNLGYGHDIDAFLEMCTRFRDKGYTVTVRGDGPGMARMPPWIRTEKPLQDPEELVASYWHADTHLVAGDPDLQDAIFPSKLWNSLAVGRPVEASGFTGAMAAELEVALKADFRRHLAQWVDFLVSLLERDGQGIA